MTSLSLEVTQVPIGLLFVEGLMDAEGKFYVAVPQITSDFQIDSNQASRSIKRLLGNDFQFAKAKTKLHPKAVNVMSLLDYERLLAKLDRAGNLRAQELRDSLVGLSLEQLFSDAFKIKFEAEERQQWLKTRQSSKQARRTFTDAIQDYMNRHSELSENDRHWMYSNVSDVLNLAIFKIKAKQLCEIRGCKRKNLRDTHNEEQLKQIEYRENHAIKLVDKLDTHPLQAIKEAIEFYSE